MLVGEGALGALSEAVGSATPDSCKRRAFTIRTRMPRGGGIRTGFGRRALIRVLLRHACSRSAMQRAKGARGTSTSSTASSARKKNAVSRRPVTHYSTLLRERELFPVSQRGGNGNMERKRKQEAQLRSFLTISTSKEELTTTAPSFPLATCAYTFEDQICKI